MYLVSPQIGKSRCLQLTLLDSSSVQLHGSRQTSYCSVISLNLSVQVCLNICFIGRSLSSTLIILYSTFGKTGPVPKQFKIPRLCTMILICGPVCLSLLKKQRCVYVCVSSEGSDVEKQSKIRQHNYLHFPATNTLTATSCFLVQSESRELKKTYYACASISRHKQKKHTATAQSFTGPK